LPPASRIVPSHRANDVQLSPEGDPFSRQSMCPCRSATRYEIAGRPRSALRLPCAKSVAVTTVALRTGEFWKRLLRQGEAVRSRSPEQGVCQPPTVVLDNSGTDPALRAVLSRPGPPKRGGISPQKRLSGSSRRPPTFVCRTESARASSFWTLPILPRSFRWRNRCSLWSRLRSRLLRS